MMKRTYAWPPTYRVDPIAAAKPPTRSPAKPPATEAATIRAVEPSPEMITGHGPGDGIPRLLRLRQIIGPDGSIPVSKNTWLAWVDSEYAPAPHLLSTRVRVWLESNIIAFITSKLTRKDA